jgi:trimeric autotransporter adhesin
MIRELRKTFLLLGLAGGILAIPAALFALTITVGTTFSGNLSVTGTLAKGNGSFLIDHPLDPKNKLLYHSFVESPDVKNIYDGVAVLNAAGEAVIELPNYFEALNRDYRYQFFPMDTPAPNLYVKQEVKANRFVIAGGPPGGKISWQVTGIRKDPYTKKYPLVVEVEKGKDTLVPKGEYLFPEVY